MNVTDLVTDDNITIMLQELDAAIARKEIQAQRMEYQREARKVGGRLMDFIHGAWKIVEPRKRFIGNWHIEVIAEHIEMLHHGEIPGIIANIPPGHAKSILLSVLGPSWEWLDDPYLQLQCVSHSHNLVMRDARKMRDIIQSPWYRSMVEAVSDIGGPPIWDMRTDRNAVEEYHNKLGGFRQSLALLAGIAGLHCRRQNIDDPHDFKDVMGDPEKVARRLAKTCDLFDTALYSRVDDDADAAMPSGRTLIMQRVGTGDMTDHFLASFPDYVHLCFPLRYDPEHPYKSPHDPRTQAGELLWPDRFPEEKVAAFESQLEKVGQLAAQGQQLPRAASGSIFRKEMFTTYDADPRRLVIDRLILACDPNVKETRRGSFFVAQLIGQRGPRYFLLDEIRGRWDIVEAEDHYMAMLDRWPTAVGCAKPIEDKANGPAMVSRLRKRGVRGVVEYRRGTDDKILHAQANALPPCAAGELYIPSPAYCPWIVEWLDEVCSFPAVPNDRVDTLAVGFGHINGDGGAVDPSEEMRAQMDALMGL
jgi:predicted phage terminase large subunit-like protein